MPNSSSSLYVCRLAGVPAQKRLIDIPMDHPTFDMIITYGDTMENRFDHTVHSLKGIELMGLGQVIRGDGAPIQETYSFMAQNFDQNIGGYVDT